MKQNIKKNLKEIIPPIAYYALEPIKGIFFRIKYLKEQWITQFHAPSNSRLFILGNGPSLKITLKKYFDVLKSEQCAVVNFFGNTNYFIELQPQWYIIADPTFFKNSKDLPDWAANQIGSLSNVLKKTVTWNINLCIPISSKNCEFIKEISKNSKINILYYNTCGNPSNIRNNRYKFNLWSKSLLAPLMQNVINTAVQIGIMIQFKEIYLLGADSSWHTLFEVDQNTNQLYSIETHFYGNQKIPLFKEDKCTSYHLHEKLESIARAFNNYCTLNTYAKYQNVKIYNSSETSWIDAFERKHLDSL